MKKTTKVWFVFPDIHFPEHDPAALSCALRAHAEIKPDNTLFLGDVLDCGMFSDHPKRTIKEAQMYDYKKIEVDPCNEMMDQVQKDTKKHTYYLLGNHEDRLERWAVSRGLASMGIYDLISPHQTIANGRTNFTMVDYSVHTGNRMPHVRIAKDLVAVHGWSFAKHSAQVHLDKSKSQSIVFGHTHRAQSVTSRDPWTDFPIKAFSPGTLSQLKPLYAVGGNPTDWTHGFAIIFVGRNSWTEYCININNGYCVLPDGREIRG